MSARKTPVLLRVAPLSGGVMALTRYTRKMIRGKDLIEAHTDGKHDVTADFDALVCELLLNPAPDIIAILDGVGGNIPISDEEREQVVAFREALVRLVERHNKEGHGAS